MSGYSAMSKDESARLQTEIEKARGNPKISVSRLARDAGVSQPLARRAARGEVRVRTPNLSRLELYVHMKLGMSQAVDVLELTEAVQSFVASGGTIAELRRIIEVHALLHRAKA